MFLKVRGAKRLVHCGHFPADNRVKDYGNYALVSDFPEINNLQPDSEDKPPGRLLITHLLSEKTH